jgi:excisionase family DNA binding protein
MRTQNRTNEVSPATEKLLSPAELADRWSVSVETLKRRRRAGELKTLKLGRAVRFKLSEIIAIEQRASV